MSIAGGISSVLAKVCVFCFPDKLAANVEAELKRLQRRKLYLDDASSMATSASADDKPQNRMFVKMFSCVMNNPGVNWILV